MPLFVTKSSVGAPAKTEFAKQDYPICFNTADNNIYVYNSALSDVKTFSGNNNDTNTTVINCYTSDSDYKQITAGSFLNLKPSAKISFKPEDLVSGTTYKTVKIQHTDVNSSYSYPYIINKIVTDSSGHITNMTYVDAKIKNIWQGSQSSWNSLTKDSSTLYLITS